MTKEEFLEKWKLERPMHEAWGNFIISKILNKLKAQGKNPKLFLKQTPKIRLKSNNSLIDKAFHRTSKNYDNPYVEIEDKVGCRFIVLLLEDIETITNIIKNESIWDYDESRHFASERHDQPLLFTYQSVHYIVRPKELFVEKNTQINIETACEIQIRTLLQHAYAELTHDAIYKTKSIISPEIQRTVAKSMALIETTDDFFSDVNKSLTSIRYEEINFQNQLDEIYIEFINKKPDTSEKSSVVILDEFDRLINDELAIKIKSMLRKKPHLTESIKSNYRANSFYRQSIIVFVYWLIVKKKNALNRDWPLNEEILEKISVDTGISLPFV